MTHFIRRGNTFTVSSDAALDVRDRLPADNFIVKKDPFENLYLEQIEPFSIPSRLYGDITGLTERVIATFNDRPYATGVLLTGPKGTGKSLLAKNVCVESAKLKMPTIVVTQPWGEAFNAFVQTIQQPCIIMYDEFEKTHSREQQEEILTLLDGIFPTKKMFILTSNEKFQIDRHMLNRPGRLFYAIDFGGLTREFILEYCEENLTDKHYSNSVCQILQTMECSFDSLKALVEEMNRFREAPGKAIRLLNINPLYDDNSSYTMQLYKGKRKIKTLSRTYKGNPLTDDSIHVYDHKSHSHYFTSDDLKSIAELTYVFTNDYGISVVMERVIRPFTYHFQDMMDLKPKERHQKAKRKPSQTKVRRSKVAKK